MNDPLRFQSRLRYTGSLGKPGCGVKREGGGRFDASMNPGTYHSSICQSRRNKAPKSPLSTVKVISQEAIMNSRFVKFNSTVLALLATLLLVSRAASAKDHKGKGSDNQARVVAHISFAGRLAVDMAMQNKGSDKVYLYVQHAESQGISIIDISKPADPKNLGVIPWPDQGMSSRMNVTGDLAIIAETGDLPARSTSNDDLVVWDLSNPAAPRVVQKFPGVVKWLQDGRNFVYVLNGDGLWVVSKAADRQPAQTEWSNYGAGW